MARRGQPSRGDKLKTKTRGRATNLKTRGRGRRAAWSPGAEARRPPGLRSARPKTVRPPGDPRGATSRVTGAPSGIASVARWLLVWGDKTLPGYRRARLQSAEG